MKFLKVFASLHEFAVVWKVKKWGKMFFERDRVDFLFRERKIRLSRMRCLTKEGHDLRRTCSSLKRGNWLPWRWLADLVAIIYLVKRRTVSQRWTETWISRGYVSSKCELLVAHSLFIANCVLFKLGTGINRIRFLSSRLLSPRNNKRYREILRNTGEIEIISTIHTYVSRNRKKPS